MVIISFAQQALIFERCVHEDKDNSSNKTRFYKRIKNNAKISYMVLMKDFCGLVQRKKKVVFLREQTKKSL